MASKVVLATHVECCNNFIFAQFFAHSCLNFLNRSIDWLGNSSYVIMLVALGLMILVLAQSCKLLSNNKHVLFTFFLMSTGLSGPFPKLVVCVNWMLQFLHV